MKQMFLFIAFGMVLMSNLKFHQASISKCYFTEASLGLTKSQIDYVCQYADECIDAGKSRLASKKIRHGHDSSEELSSVSEEELFNPYYSTTRRAPTRRPGFQQKPKPTRRPSQKPKPSRRPEHPRRPLISIKIMGRSRRTGFTYGDELPYFSTLHHTLRDKTYAHEGILFVKCHDLACKSLVRQPNKFGRVSKEAKEACAELNNPNSPIKKLNILEESFSEESFEK
ncbi:uncharacterized protein LOC123296282 [Chrysoperla carnea]|uniref:uncharacterized protein LOC123296282 n=1 Tax=Chrysoperla carnea TaxID=189513 RepID=UPI001D08DB9A|nr:uncharacterized protein LOC123296282 [Chrysoperla carnea]